MWDEITYVSSNIKGRLWEWRGSFIPHFTTHMFDFSVPMLKLVHASKRSPDNHTKRGTEKTRAYTIGDATTDKNHSVVAVW